MHANICIFINFKVLIIPYFSIYSDEQGVKVHDPNEPQEFSTELKFTAVGGTNSRARRSSFDENSDTSDDEIARLKPVLKTDSNWLTPDAERKPERFGNGVKVRGQRNWQRNLKMFFICIILYLVLGLFSQFFFTCI